VNSAEPLDELTRRQRDILHAIRRLTLESGHAPSIREVAEAVGIRSAGSLHYQYQELMAKGHLRRVQGRPRTVEVRLPGEADFPARASVPDQLPGEAAFRPTSTVGHVFISYVREDSPQVDQLQRTLEAAGVPVWRDTADLWPGQDWRAVIGRAITDNALVFIACFSRHSLRRAKSYMNAELLLAAEQLRLRRPEDPWLIPVRFDDCDIPDRDLGGGKTLASIQRADLFGDGCGEAFTRLVTAVRRILEGNSGAHW
jgi:TIR domain/LexA DNA binding domain